MVLWGPGATEDLKEVEITKVSIEQSELKFSSETHRKKTALYHSGRNLTLKCSLINTV
jgi:hypothetical protein